MGTHVDLLIHLNFKANMNSDILRDPRIKNITRDFY